MYDCKTIRALKERIDALTKIRTELLIANTYKLLIIKSLHKNVKLRSLARTYEKFYY